MSKEVIRPNQFARADMALLAAEEAELQLNETQKQELAESYGSIFNSIQPGKLVTGAIVRKDSDGIVIDINYKSDGFISRHEFSPHEFEALKVGDQLEVILDQLENSDGDVVLSHEKAKALKAWDKITKLFEEGKPIEGEVTHKVKGGLNVDIGLPAFLPGSQIDLQRVNDFDQYLGQRITANIIKLNKKRGNVIISRRKYLFDRRSEDRKKILETLSEGQVIRGQVKNITNYGAFIDIGGVDGLLHITDMTWGRIGHPSELLKIGDTITVKILSFDKEHEKISLGLKQLSGNPWKSVSETLKPGSRVKGKISSITDYGLFVEVHKGVEGLVHISEISWTDRIDDLAKKFKVGDEIEVYVVSIDPDNRRMSLSIKQLKGNPWETINEKFKQGDIVKGTISNITDFGIFVQLMPGIDGLVHISDLSWTEHIDHPSDIYKKGDSIEAVVLNIDKEHEKISLGIKQLKSNPWDSLEQEYPINTIVEGTVSKITNFGAFVKLQSGIEGLVHISELSDKQVDKVEDVLSVGQKAQFRVINVNKEERKLGLSMKLSPKAPSSNRAERGEGSRSEGRQHSGEDRGERGDRGDRSSSKTSSPIKQKSLLQLELEKHVRKQQEENDNDNND
jgi:small subunit ribosomal protein S1